MYGKCAVGISSLRHHVHQSALPVIDGIIGIGIPCVISHTVKCQLGSLAMFHRIALYTCHFIFGKIGSQTVDRTLKQYVAAIVGHRVIPPVQCGALDTGIDKIKCLVSEVAAHHGTCPEHLHVGVQFTAINGKLTILSGLRPQLRIVSRTNHQIGHIALSLDKITGEIVQQFHLLLGIGTLALYIIKEYCKRTHTEVVHHIELVDQAVIVLLVPAYILPGMYRPHEIDMVTFGILHKFTDIFSFIGRIGLTPVWRAVVRVILRTIDVIVHLVLSIKIKQRHAHLMRPWRAIESLYHTTVLHLGIVIDHHHRQLITTLRHFTCKNLTQCLQSVESATLIKSGYLHLFRTNIKKIGSRHLFHTGFTRFLGTEINGQWQSGRSLFKETYRTGKFLLLIFNLESATCIEHTGIRTLNTLRSGVNHKALMIHFMTRHRLKSLNLAALRRQIEVRFLSYGSKRHHSHCHSRKQQFKSLHI